MNKNDFTLVFQYDEDEAGSRRADNRIKRLIEAQDGIYIDAFEAYGMIDVNCSFKGTPEQAIKIATEIAEAQQSTTKMSYFVKQQYVVLTIENYTKIENSSEMIKELEKVIEANYMNRVEADEYHPENLQIRLTSQESFNQYQHKLNAIIQQYSNAHTFKEIDFKTIAQGNNYSEKKKPTF